MRRIIFLIPIIALFTFCQTYKSNSGNTYNRRTITKLPAKSTGDTIIITGVEKIPLYGRSEHGTHSDIEGSWELVSISGTILPQTSSIHTESIKSDAAIFKNDTTISTRVNNGDTIVTTEITRQIPGAPIKTITPPQGNNYHIPQKPFISFYGSNETFTGFTGCNKISGRFKFGSPNYISFHKAAAATKMVCIGDYDENAFLNTLQQINKYTSQNGTLTLLHNDKELLVFTKK